MKGLRLSARPPLLLCLGFLLLAPSSQAQTKGQGAGFVPRSENYLLGPGDVLRVAVAGFPDLGQESVIIPPDGVVSFPELGTFRLSGRTRASVENDIRQRLVSRVRLRNPRVAVSITAVRPDIAGNVVLSGEGIKGGNYTLRENERLSDLLAESGLSERLEERRAVLVRGQARIPLNLSRAASAPGSAADIVLRTGDSIAVSTVQAGKITLQGDVQRPGIYQLHLQPRGEALELGLKPRLSDLITIAGGLRDTNASAGSVGTTSGTDSIIAPALTLNGVSPSGTRTTTGTIAGTGTMPAPAPLPVPIQNNPRLKTTYATTLQRGGTQLELDVEAALANVAGPENVNLLPGDYINIRVVPPISVYVDGASSKTGSFQLAPGAGVLELLTLAGPLTRAPGDLTAVVRRGDESLPLSLTSLLVKNDPKANVRLRNGDIVQLRELETLNVSVNGQVARSGSVKVRPGATLFDALIAAGGVTSGTALDGARLSLVRRQNNGVPRTYAANAAGIVNSTDFSTNYVLREGDIINLTTGAPPTVLVSGQVVTPGTLPITEGKSLAEVIIKAGGPKDDAALTRVRVSRGNKTDIVDAYDAVKNGRPLNYDLQPGDIINVPVNPNQVAVNGAVAKQGYYPIPERGQLTILDLATQAGLNAGVKKIYLLQQNANGTINPNSRQDISIIDVQQGKQPNLVLAPRTIVFAQPPGGGKKDPLQYLGAIGALSFLF